MRNELGIGWILSAYGLTENHALATLTAPDDPPEVVATTVGRPLADIELRLADDAGRDVPAGSEGEVLLRGPFLFSGYYDDEEATRRTVVDGWLHTGDVGRFDEDGYVHITDRKKDMFIVGGFNVAPAEVEKSIMAMPGVSQVAVVGMPDDYFGEVGAAFVIPLEGTHDDPGRRRRLRPGHLANFKVPRRVEIVDTSPDERHGQGAQDRAASAPGASAALNLRSRLCGVRARGQGWDARDTIGALVHPMSTELVAAEDVGVDPKRLDLFLARARLEVEHGPLPSAQVAVARQGRLVAFETYGDATNGHRYILQSVGRNVVAAATWKLLGDGALGLGERVADVIPEFGTNGKDVVTVEQVLTHSGGFPFAPLGYPKMLDRQSRLEAFARWRLDWEPGSRLQFHLTSAAWVIAELVRAADRQGLRRVPADRDRRASRPGVRPAAARRSLP